MTLHTNARTRQSSSLIIWLVIEMSVKYKNPMEAQWSENQRQGDLGKVNRKKVTRIKVSALPLAYINLSPLY